MLTLRSPHARTRRRALEDQAPRLSDEDLFALDRLLDDRSRLPVAAYLRELMRRDPGRAAGLILGRPRFGPKTGPTLVYELRRDLERKYGSLERAALYRAVLLRSPMDVWSVGETLVNLSLVLCGEGPERSPTLEDALREIATQAVGTIVRLEAARWLFARTKTLPESVWADAEESVTARSPDVRTAAACILIHRSDSTACDLVRRTALRDASDRVREDVLTEVVREEEVSSDRMKRLVEDATASDPSAFVRASLLARVLDRRGCTMPTEVVLHHEPETYGWVQARFGPGSHDPWLAGLLRRVADEDPDATLRQGARELLSLPGRASARACR